MTEDKPGIVTVAAGEVKELEVRVEGAAKTVEAEAAAEDAEIKAAVQSMHDRALALVVAEIVRAKVAEQHALAWARTKREALIGIAIGIVAIAIAKHFFL